VIPHTNAVPVWPFVAPVAGTDRCAPKVGREVRGWGEGCASAKNACLPVLLGAT